MHVLVQLYFSFIALEMKQSGPKLVGLSVGPKNRNLLNIMAIRVVESLNGGYKETLVFASYWGYPLVQFSKFKNFLWVCWFLGKNLSNFVPPVWKLYNPYCHNGILKYHKMNFIFEIVYLLSDFVNLFKRIAIKVYALCIWSSIEESKKAEKPFIPQGCGIMMTLWGLNFLNVKW